MARCGKIENRTHGVVSAGGTFLACQRIAVDIREHGIVVDPSERKNPQ